MLDSSIKWPGLSERNQTNPSDEDQSQDSQYASSDFSYEYISWKNFLLCKSMKIAIDLQTVTP